MKTIDIVRRSTRSLFSAKARTVLTTLAIAVGAFTLTLTLGASNGAQKYADEIVSVNFDPSELIVTKDKNIFRAADDSKPKEFEEGFGTIATPSGIDQQIKLLDENDISVLEEIKGISSARPAINLSLKYITRDGQKKYVGTAQEYSNYRQPELLAGSIPDRLENHTIILPEGFVEPLGFDSAKKAVGKKVRLAVENKAKQADNLSSLLRQNSPSDFNKINNVDNVLEEEYKVIAVTKTPGNLVQPGTALNLNINGDDLQRLNNFKTKNSDSFGRYISAYVKVENWQDTNDLQQAKKMVESKGYNAQSVMDTQKIITQVIGVLQGIVTVFGVIAVIASIFGVINTMYISVLQRTREIGLMKALGMHKRNINLLFLVEAGLLGLFGGALGSIIAVIAGTLLNPVISDTLELGDQNLLIFNAIQIIGLISALVTVAVLAGLFPARKASKLDPIEALRTE
jgi:putative ABC transport system permease protein